MTDDVGTTLGEIVRRLEEAAIPSMLVGSVAALAHGRARATQDFDLVVEADEARLVAFVRALPPERFYASEEAAVDALRRESLFNVIDVDTGWKTDIIPLKMRSFSRTEFDRRRPIELFGVRVDVATVEDTLLAKLEWSKLGGGSARQLEDAAALLRLHPEVDRAYLAVWVRVLGLEAEWDAVEGG